MVGTIATSAAGPYTVRLLGSAGQTLVAHAFTPATIADSRNAGLIALTLPYAPGTTKIVIETGVPARALRSITVSSAAPAVSAVTVTQREISPKRTTITWRGTDADGDALSYAILYSADAKQTWRPIAQGIRGTRFVADSAAFEGTHGRATGFIRIIAHDGVLTGRSESAGFVVANKSPHVRIISPVTDATYEGNQFVMLQALGADPEDGSFPSNSLVWKSDRDGPLGRGALVQARSLSKGDHVITVSATDSEGKIATASAIVHFGNRAAPLVVACTRGSGNATTLGGRSANGAPFRVSVTVVKRMINQGRGVYATDAAGNLARIRIVRRGNTDYLRTVATGRQTENLLRLPTCP
jgi:hypothetical protein